MRAAGERGQRRRSGANLQRAPSLGRRQVGADRRRAGESARAGEPQPFERRRIDRAGDRPAAFDQRDVDGELAVAGDEFARPVERIDQDEPFRDGDRRAGGGRLFGDDRDRRRPGRQTLADRRLGPLVGGGHRTAVALGARRAAVRVFGHHRRAGGERDARQQQRRLVAAGRCKIEPPCRRRIVQASFLSSLPLIAQSRRDGESNTIAPAAQRASSAPPSAATATGKLQ